MPLTTFTPSLLRVRASESAQPSPHHLTKLNPEVRGSGHALLSDHSHGQACASPTIPPGFWPWCEDEILYLPYHGVLGPILNSDVHCVRCPHYPKGWWESTGSHFVSGLLQRYSTLDDYTGCGERRNRLLDLLPSYPGSLEPTASAAEETQCDGYLHDWSSVSSYIDALAPVKIDCRIHKCFINVLIWNLQRKALFSRIMILCSEVGKAVIANQILQGRVMEIQCRLICGT